MTAKLRTSPAGRKFIKAFEGFRRKSAPLPGGGWVIGYGHTKSAREGVTVSEDDADKLLIYDLIPVEAALNEHVAAPLTQNQFDALASFTLNIGQENFLDSTVLKRLNQNRPLEAALAFDQWRDTLLDGRQVVVEALLRRRAAERALFLTPPGGQAPAPTPEVAPIAEDAPARLVLPVVSYKADLAAADAGGTFLVIQGVEPPPESETPADEAAPEPEVEPAAEEPEAELEPASEPEAEPALEPEAEPEPTEESAEWAEAESDAVGFTPDAALETDAELVPEDEAEAEERNAPAEAALEQDEAVEEVVLELEGEGDDDDGDAEEAEETAAEAEADEAQGELSWAEMARRRAQSARQAQPVSPPPASRDDLPVQRSEAEWALEDESEYSPERDRAGAVWYVLFLVIGAGMACLGAMDSWRRSTGQVDESFLYGPAIAAFGVLFMAITGWFLIKRILAFR